VKTILFSSVAVVLLGLGTQAHAGDMFEYNWNHGEPGGGRSNAGGTWNSFNATYNSSTNTFSLDVTFSDAVTNALSFAISPGPNPKNHPGELAYFYMADGTNQPEDVTLSAYGYNGKNTNSYKDGNGYAGGNQSPDLIASSELDDSWIQSMSVTTEGGMRTFSLTIDASIINGHVPMYPSATEPWTGVEFGESIGIWARAWDRSGANGTTYEDGLIKGWSYGKNGWFDAANLEATVIPLPPAFALGGFGLLSACGLAALRRRTA